MEENVKVPWWQKTWVVVLACIFIPPAGIALLWIGKKGGQTLRIILTVILGFYSLAWLSGFAGGSKTVAVSDQTATKTEVVAEDTSVADKAAAEKAAKEEQTMAMVVLQNAVEEYLTDVKYPWSSEDWIFVKSDNGTMTISTKATLKDTSEKQLVTCVATLGEEKYSVHFLKVGPKVYIDDGTAE